VQLRCCKKNGTALLPVAVTNRLLTLLPSANNVAPVGVVPELPDVPDEPEVPDVPSTPSTPSNADVPFTPFRPEDPDVPEEPDVPEAPPIVKLTQNSSPLIAAPPLKYKLPAWKFHHVPLSVTPVQVPVTTNLAVPVIDVKVMLPLRLILPSNVA